MLTLYTAGDYAGPPREDLPPAPPPPDTLRRPSLPFTSLINRSDAVDVAAAAAARATGYTLAAARRRRLFKEAE